MTDYKVKRGPWGKPWITRDGKPLDWPEGQEKPLNGHLYERPSDISGNLDTKENLSPYHQAQAVLGVCTEPEPSLIRQFRALASKSTDPWTNDKEEVKSLLKLARLLGGEERKSGSGTALHTYTDILDEGREIEHPIPAFTPWLECYQECMAKFRVVDKERFIVTDDLENPDSDDDVRCAGNYDKLLQAIEDIYVGKKLIMEAGEVVIGDVKTGKSDNEWAMKPTIQVAVYARGKHYDQQTGERTPLHPDVSPTKGLLIHMPFNGGGHPECLIYPLNLELGWTLAKTSAFVTRSRKMRVNKRDAVARAKWVPVPATSPEESPTPSEPSTTTS